MSLHERARRILDEAEVRTAHRAATPGAVSTPLDVAVRLTDDAWNRPRTVLDPACGTGPFLIAAALRLWEDHGDDTVEARLSRLSCVHGWDVDPVAVETARWALCTLAGGHTDLSIDVRDALEASGDYDLVLGNPPWVGSTQMDPAHRTALRRRFATARGNWDLWCPFVEQALSLTAPGGTHAFLVPDKLASAPFAAATRALLGPHVRLLHDLGHVFPGHQVRGLAYVAGPGEGTRLRRREHEFSIRLGEPWALPEPGEAPLLERLHGCRPLGDLADVSGAATVAEAYAWGEALGDAGAPLVNSGLIDPWVTHWGQRDIRYLGQRHRTPRVRIDVLSERRLGQLRAPKLIMAGMTRRLEVFPDREGRWLAAKSTSVLRPTDPRDLLPLAAWLNSRACSAWYRAVYGSLCFQGGYLRVGPPQLRTIPVPELPSTIGDLAAARLAGEADDADIDDAIDHLLGL
jgi:predicted RNA methylase